MNMSIVSLRDRQNGLAERFATISAAVKPLFSLRVRFTGVLAKAAGYAWEENFSFREGFRWTDPPDYEEKTGTEVPVFSYDFLLVIIQDDVEVRNLLRDLTTIRDTSTKAPPIIAKEYLQSDREPVTHLWMPEEVAIVRQAYMNRITKATTTIRNINTRWKAIMRLRRRMPDFIKSSLLDMFGEADHAEFRYHENDFSCATPQPLAMAARWLAPFTGAEHAKTIEQALKVIGEQSAPLPHEPPTLDFFTSHTSNAIKLFADKEAQT